MKSIKLLTQLRSFAVPDDLQVKIVHRKDGVDQHYHIRPHQDPKPTLDYLKDTRKINQWSSVNDVANSVTPMDKGSVKLMAQFGSYAESTPFSPEDYQNPIGGPRIIQEIHGSEKQAVVDRVMQGMVHDNFTTQVEGVYRVDYDHPEFDQKAQELGNVQRLWHGVSNQRALSAVATGLQVPKTYVNGWMFGPGVYFAPDASKSVQYLGSGQWHNMPKEDQGILLDCDVVMGNTYEATGSMGGLSADGKPRLNSWSTNKRVFDKKMYQEDKKLHDGYVQDYYALMLKHSPYVSDASKDGVAENYTPDEYLKTLYSRHYEVYNAVDSPPPLPDSSVATRMDDIEEKVKVQIWDASNPPGKHLFPEMSRYSTPNDELKNKKSSPYYQDLFKEHFGVSVDDAIQEMKGVSKYYEPESLVLASPETLFFLHHVRKDPNMSDLDKKLLIESVGQRDFTSHWDDDGNYITTPVYSFAGNNPEIHVIPKSLHPNKQSGDDFVATFGTIPDLGRSGAAQKIGELASQETMDEFARQHLGVDKFDPMDDDHQYSYYSHVNNHLEDRIIAMDDAVTKDFKKWFQGILSGDSYYGGEPDQKKRLKRISKELLPKMPDSSLYHREVALDPDEKFDSVTALTKAEGGSVQYPEMVVYDPHQVQVRHVIKVKRTRKR